MLNSRNKYGDNAFLAAVFSDRIDLVKYLIETVPNIAETSRDHYENNCFIIASAGNLCRLQAELRRRCPRRILYAKSELRRLQQTDRLAQSGLLRQL